MPAIDVAEVELTLHAEYQTAGLEITAGLTAADKAAVIFAGRSSQRRAIRWSQDPLVVASSRPNRFLRTVGVVRANGLVSKMQVTRVGWVAMESEGLATSRRMRLPRHVILQCYFIGCAVWRTYLQVRPYKPIVKRCKRQFFGMKNSGNAGAPLVAGQCLRDLHCAC